MRKAKRYPELPVVGITQLAPHPFTKRWRAFANVYSHIKYSALCNSHQFALGLLQLVMQTSQDTFGTFAVVVLNKINIQTSDIGKVFGIEGFKEEAPAIAKNLRLQN